jgi:hypothetical protein
VIEGVAEEARDDGGPVVVVSVRLRRRRSKRGFCGRCARLSPGPKLASLTWLREVELPGVGELGDDPNVCYRAMDWLLEIEHELTEAVYWATADLLDLEVDLLLFDTTSTYWETERADPAPGEEHGPTADAHLPADDDEVDSPRSGFRTYGKSKDHRPDLPQVVVGMAVTRTGIPIRVWCWPVTPATRR